MGRKTRQWIACMTSTLLVSTIGACFVWNTPLMVRLLSPGSPLPMTPGENALVTSIIEIGEFMSTIPAGILADKFGRKTTIMAAGPLVLFGWILTATTRSLPVLYFVRIIHGMGVAVGFVVPPMYIAETSDPNIRGLLGGMFQAMFYFGCFYAYVAGPYLSYDMYAYACAVLPVLSFIFFFFVPESPYYLLMKNDEIKAKKSLEWLRCSSDVEQEFLEIKASVNEDMKNKGSWKDLFATKKDRKSFFLVQLVCLIKYLGGMTAVIVYASQTFEKELSDFLGSDEMTIVFGAILLTTTFLASFVTDSVGRKPLLLTSTIGAAFFNFVIALIYFLDSQTSVDVSSYKWITYVCLICFSVISNIGLGPLMQTIQAEYFPSHTRAMGGAVTEMVAAASAYISVIQYQALSDYFGSYMNYAIFCAISIIGTITFAILITETAGQTLGEIQNSFGDKSKKINV